MVNGVGNNGQNPEYVKLKGQNKKIDVNNLTGLRKTQGNEAFFNMADKNKNGIIEQDEAQVMRANILNMANGNHTLSNRETKAHFGEMGTFEAISALADQQIAYEAGKEYVETNGNTSTHYTPEEIYTRTTDRDGVVTLASDDGSQEIRYPDGSKQIVTPDGTVTSYDKDGNKTSVMHNNGHTTTFPDANTSITKNAEGQTTQTIKMTDGQIVRTDFEYQDGKTIEREYSDIGSDAPLTSITVREQTSDGHKVDTKYSTEEDMTNNRPSEVVTDAHNPTLKTVTTYTYNEDGSYSTETTNSAGEKTVKKFNADGTEITEQNENNTTEIAGTHTVVKGESITQIVKNEMAKQGITNPTPEQLREAKQEFLELNKDLVKTYNGVKEEWKGNKFFYPDDVVKIPNFVKTEAPETPDETAAPEATVTTDPQTVSETSETETNPTPTDNVEITPEMEARKQEVQDTLGSECSVEFAQDGSLVVKDKNGKILPEVTKMANGATDNDSDINLMMAHDTNESKSLDLEEYKTFITGMLADAGIEITEANRAQIDSLIAESFNSMDNIDQNKALSREELKQNAESVINQLADSINTTLDSTLVE